MGREYGPRPALISARSGPDPGQNGLLSLHHHVESAAFLLHYLWGGATVYVGDVCAVCDDLGGSKCRCEKYGLAYQRTS